MQVANKLMRFKMAVSDMPRAKAFYVDKLGLKAESDYRRDDHEHDDKDDRTGHVGIFAPEGTP